MLLLNLLLEIASAALAAAGEGLVGAVDFSCCCVDRSDSENYADVWGLGHALHLEKSNVCWEHVSLKTLLMQPCCILM